MTDLGREMHLGWRGQACLPTAPTPTSPSVVSGFGCPQQPIKDRDLTGAVHLGDGLWKC